MAISDEDAKKIAEAMADLNKETSGLDKAFQKLSKSNVDLVKAFSVFGKEAENLVDTAKDLSSALAQLATDAGKAKVLNLFVEKMIKDSQELANIMEKTRASYVGATGDISGYGDTMSTAMINASNNISKFGVDVSAATVAVRSSMPIMVQNFNDLNDAQRANIETTITTISLLKELGVGAEISAANINSMADSLYMNGQVTGDFNSKMQAANYAVAETTLALTSMGYSIQESAQMMQKASDITLVFGQQSLTNLAAVAKQTRISLDELIAVSSKFDTFDSAAQHVGKLNALLGADYLGVTDMMFAEPAEQVKMISGAFEEAGLTAASLTSMSDAEQKFTLMTIQSTLGLKSKQDAMKFLQADEFERSEMLVEQANQQEKQVEAQQKLNQILFESMPAIEQLAMAFKNLTSLLQPLFTMINAVANGVAYGVNIFSSWTKGLEGGAKAIATTVAAIVTIIAAVLAYRLALLSVDTVKDKLSGLGDMFSGAGDKAKKASEGLGDLAPTTDKASASAGNAWKNMLAFGAALLLIGGGIYLATTGIANMAESIAKLGPMAETFNTTIKYLTIAFIVFAVALVVVAFAGSAAAGPMLALGAAFLMIGAGIGIAAAGISLLVNAFSTLGDVAVSLGNILKDIILGSLDRVNTIFTTIGSLDATNILGVGTALFTVAAGLGAIMAVSAGGGIASGISSAIGGVFGLVGSALGGPKTVGPLEMLESLKTLATTELAQNIEKIAASIDLMVKALNTPINTANIESLEKAAKTMSLVAVTELILRTTGAGSTGKTTTPVEPKIEIATVVVKFDDVTQFNAHVEKIVMKTLKESGVVTR